MDINILITISCICILFVIGRIFIVPIKWILKLMINSILGALLIWIINLIGGIWGFHIGINVYTSIIVRYFRDTGSNLFDIIKDFNIKRSPTSIFKRRGRIGLEQGNIGFPDENHFFVSNYTDENFVIWNFLCKTTVQNLSR